MKLLEEIKHYNKEYVYEHYTRIIDKFKSYQNITKVKMIQEIFKCYEDYQNIIDICTTRELKVLKMILDNDMNHIKKEYEWERENLQNKFLIMYDFRKFNICDELKSIVKKALNHVDWKMTNKNDEINEFMVSFCKIQGSGLIQPLIKVSSSILNIEPQKLLKHIFENKLFKYYVSIIDRDFDTIGENIPTFVYNDYLIILDELDEQRRLQGLAASCKIDTNDYKCLFYNDFNLNNPIINKFYNELINLPFYYHSVIDLIKEYSLLNVDKTELKNTIQNVPALKNCDLSDFFELMDKAMDEMPSGALNGLTPKEARKVRVKELEEQRKKQEKYVKQKNACLSKKEAKLFYKLYFGILDYTNKKYNIIPNYKIYNQININPYDIVGVIDKFWEEKEKIIFEFCVNNPFRFNKEELNMVQEFRKGFRGTFVIVEYLEEYTALMNTEKVFMIKGINSNIDKVIPFNQLPYMVQTSVMPFNDKIIYDGVFSSYPVKFDNGFNKAVENDYKRFMKYYHL